MRSQPENRCLSKGVAFAAGPQFWWVFEESSGPPLSGKTTAEAGFFVHRLSKRAALGANQL
jgi:hypothetical protein